MNAMDIAQLGYSGSVALFLIVPLVLFIISTVAKVMKG